MANLRRGLYNNGIAARTGRLHRGRYNDWYLICIDFDTCEAFLTWCNGDYDLDSLAKWTRVDWHNNPERIHVFFLSKTPLKDLAQSKDNQIIEVYGNNPHLVCVSGNHKDGNPIRPYGTKEIAVIDEAKKLEIESRIKRVIPTYLDEDSDSKYIQELEKPETLVPAGSVHHANRSMLMSVYFRWKGEFDPDKMSDEQRFQWVVDWDRKKAVQANRPAYIDANPKKLEELWEGIKRKYQGQRQEQRDKREEEAKSKRTWINDVMPGCIAYQINPNKFIVGTPDSKIAEITRRVVLSKTELSYVIEYTKTFTACKPVKIVKHINTLSFLKLKKRFTIEFRGMEPSGCFTMVCVTISEIVTELEEGNALHDRGIKIAIQAQIKGFEQAGLLEIDNSIKYTGFFPSNDNKKIIASKVDVPTEYPDVADALRFIDELLKWYKGREDLLSHMLLWFMIAPLSFIFKVIKAPLLEWIHLWGWANSGKSSSGEIGLAIDGHEKDGDFNLNMKRIMSDAQFGNIISETTFPKLINELDLIGQDKINIVNNIVIAIDAIVFRKPMDRNGVATEGSPSFAPLFLTGNPQNPTISQYVKRVKTRNFPEREVHLQTASEAIEYKNWLADNISRCRTLGLARNKLVMDSQECQRIILDTKLPPFEKSRRIWNAIYKSAGKELPSFFSKNLDEDQMQDSIADRKHGILTALDAWVVDKCRSLDGNGDASLLKQYNDPVNRLTQLVDKGLVSCIRRTRDNELIFSRQMVVELKHFGADQLDLPTFADAIPGAEYNRRLSGGHSGIRCSVKSLVNAFKITD
jgi:hypothetical protein